MPTLNIDGRSVQVDDGFLKLSPDQQNATVDEIAKSLAPKPLQEPEAADHGLSERQKLSPVEKALSPVTSYPATYDRMNKDAREQVSHGIDQLSHPSGIMDVAKGAANTALGAAGYVASPISAAYRSVIGQPLEDVTGIPREYTEFAAQLATPGIGLAAGTKAAPVVKAAEQASPSVAELKAAARANYESPALTGLDVKPSTISKFATKAKIDLNARGLDENLAPKTFNMLSGLEKVPDGPAAIFTGNNIKSLRQLLSNAAGEPGQEGVAASRALSALEDHIPKIDPKDVIAGSPKAASEALTTANADYSAAKHAETIDNKTIRAQQRASASNSGQNVANTVRQRLADIINPERPELQRGFTSDELDLMRQIVEGTKTQNSLRWAGNALGGGGGLGALHTSAAGAGAGGVVAGPVGAAVGAVAVPAVGHILKAIGNRGTLMDAAKLSEMIRARAPLASSADKFTVSADKFIGSPSSATYAAALISARNLATNLKGSGIDISPADLLRSLQSPQKAAADDQQPDVPRRIGQ